MRNRLNKLTLLGALLLSASMMFGETIRITKGPVVEHAGSNSAVIAWSTNASGATIVRYGTDPNHLSERAEMPWGSLTHRVTLKNLRPGETYYYQVDSTARGPEASSAVQRFTTEGNRAGRDQDRDNDHDRDDRRHHPNLRITHGPVLEHVGDTNATVAWSTDLPSSSTVRFGTDPRNLNHKAEEPWGATTHRVQLKNLRPNTQYYFSVHSAQGKNAPGQAEDTPPQPFTTAQQGREARGHERDHDHDHR